MSEQNLILYVDSKFTSPYAMSVFVTLTEKGLPFEMKTIDLGAREHLNPVYSDLSVTQRIPTLVHGDFKLSESSAISEYLEDVFPPPEYARVYPVDLQKRARARQVQAWLRSDFLHIREERNTETIFIRRAERPLTRSALASAFKLYLAADKLIEEGALNLFDDWCIADMDLALMLNRLLLNGEAVPSKLEAYAKHQWQRESVQAWVNQKRL